MGHPTVEINKYLCDEGPDDDEKLAELACLPIIKGGQTTIAW